MDPKLGTYTLNHYRRSTKLVVVFRGFLLVAYPRSNFDLKHYKAWTWRRYKERRANGVTCHFGLAGFYFARHYPA